MKPILIVVVVALAALALFATLRIRRALRGTRNYDTVAPPLPASLANPAILVFSKTNGYRHKDAIPAANAAIAAIAQRHGWSVFFTENGAVFTSRDLPRFRAVVWNNTSGDVLNDAQKAAFRNFIETGGGFVGLHGAGGDFHYEWAWYVDTLIGAQFIGHTYFPQFPTATIRMENRGDPATKNLPAEWSRRDEWYSFAKSPRANGATILATVDESTYRPQMAWKNIRMGADHPVVWKHAVGKGRAFYSALGHAGSAYSDPNYVALIEGAIAWSAGLEP